MPDECGAAMGRNADKQRFYLGSDSSVSVWARLSQNGSISKYNFSRYRWLKTLSEVPSHMAGKLRRTHIRTAEAAEAPRGRGVHAYTWHTPIHGDTCTRTGRQPYCFPLKQLDLVPDLKSSLLNTRLQKKKGQGSIIQRSRREISGMENIR